MGTYKLQTNISSLQGDILVPGDKSISHRSVMFGAVAEGVTTVTGFLMGDDCLSTVSCFRQLGIEIEQEENKLTIHGKGWDGLRRAQGSIECWKFRHNHSSFNGDFSWPRFSCYTHW